MASRSKHHQLVVAVALTEAVERAGGTQAALARKLDCTRQNVSLMRKHRRVTIERALQIERVLGIPRHRLVPEVFE